MPRVIICSKAYESTSDMPRIRELSRKLVRAGYSIQGVSSTITAEKAKSLKPAIVITDGTAKDVAGTIATACGVKIFQIKNYETICEDIAPLLSEPPPAPQPPAQPVRRGGAPPPRPSPTWANQRTAAPPPQRVVPPARFAKTPAVRPSLTVIIVIEDSHAAGEVFKTVKSTLQGDPNLVEVLAIDDGTTSVFATKLRALNDPRLLILRRPWSFGRADSIRLGIAQASAPRVLTLDVGAVAEPGAFDAIFAGEVAGRGLPPALQIESGVVYARGDQ